MKSNAMTTAAKKAQSIMNRLGPKNHPEDEPTLRKRLNTFKALTEARRQIVSANHNLKIVLERMANDSSQRAGLLDEELETIVGNTLLFLRNSHNSIMKLGQNCDYNFRYRGPKKDEIKRYRVKHQLDKLISVRKLMSRG